MNSAGVEQGFTSATLLAQIFGLRTTISTCVHHQQSCAQWRGTTITHILPSSYHTHVHLFPFPLYGFSSCLLEIGRCFSHLFSLREMGKCVVMSTENDARNMCNVRPSCVVSFSFGVIQQYLTLRGLQERFLTHRIHICRHSHTRRLWRPRYHRGFPAFRASYWRRKCHGSLCTWSTMAADETRVDRKIDELPSFQHPFYFLIWKKENNCRNFPFVDQIV